VSKFNTGSLPLRGILPVTSCVRGRHDMPPPRPATEASIGSLEPSRPSRARSANTRYSAGRPHTPPADRMYATNRHQTASSLNAPKNSFVGRH